MTFRRGITWLSALMLGLAPVVFFTDLTRNPYLVQVVIVRVALLALAGAFLVRGLFFRQLTFKKTPLDLSLGAFFAAATLSWGIALLAGLRQPYLFHSVLSEGGRHWVFLSVNALLAFYAAVHVVDRGNRTQLIYAVFASMFIASVYGILQFFAIEPVWPAPVNPFGGRSVSTFGNPNFLSSYIIMTLPVVLVFFAGARTLASRCVYGVLLLTGFAALVCTMARSSWCGFLAGMVVLLAAWRRYEPALFKKQVPFIAVSLFCCAVLFVAWPGSRLQGNGITAVERLKEAGETHERYYASFYQRRLIWSCAWHMVRENPVMGRGWGCFELYYPFYQGKHLFLDVYRDLRTHANNAHNELLEVWSQTGTLGMGLYLLFLLVLGRSAVLLLRVTGGRDRLLVAAFSAALAGMLADNMLNVSLHFAIPALLFWWTAGMMTGMGPNREAAVPLRRLPALAAVLALLAGATVLLAGTVVTFAGEICFFKGYKLSLSRQPAAAIPCIEKAKALTPLEVNINYCLGNCYARIGRDGEALAAYEDALRSNAGYDEIYYNLAMVAARTGDSDRAVREFSRTLFINPLSLESYSGLCTVFLSDTRYTGAGITLVRRMLTLFPENREGWNNLGVLYTRKGAFGEAADAYRRALAIDPGFATARENLNSVLSRAGGTDTGEAEYDRLFSRVKKEVAAQEWRSASALVDRLVRLRPGSFAARFYAGNIYFMLGELDTAIGHYREAEAISPGVPALLGNLGLACLERGATDEAKTVFLRLSAVDPSSELARRKLEEIGRAGRQEEDPPLVK